ncbi:hypothetical protein EES44_07860 [Streptomyces sp. ADI96-15]|uniref:hypothetical protein n=1 Tax=Streptomyces sp. ADI96-15 TaxID=1522761 RepID=UPI000FAA048A|nr:hypothetical protein [Streptomyces sp. ADI96-15]RPK69036.1 hypothetical protein EES44_07860 [Streptomyces sp. ADI96-15]
MTLIPPPPNYPPAYGPAPEPTVIVVTPDPPATRPRRRWLRNTTAVAAALAPVFGGYSAATALGTLLTTVRTEASTPAAWVIAAAVLGATWLLDHHRGTWLHRTLLAAAVLGVALSMPWLTALLYLMTGVTT